MRFLDLPEDIITEIFTQIDQEWYSDRIAAFYSLRLVCKSLATLAEASVFSSLLVRLEGANLSGLSTRSSEIGKHVKKLDLDLVVDTSEKDWAEKLQLPQRDQQLAFLLSNLTSIRDITVHLLCNISIPLDKTRSALQSALGQIQDDQPLDGYSHLNSGQMQWGNTLVSVRRLHQLHTTNHFCGGT
ncbi:hypothetical protein FRC20_009176 [Serendipita sp. 405]|nr:hypothetical protein FRC20_009176 [Serendipita sp. 405]